MLVTITLLLSIEMCQAKQGIMEMGGYTADLADHYLFHGIAIQFFTNNLGQVYLCSTFYSFQGIIFKVCS